MSRRKRYLCGLLATAALFCAAALTLCWHYRVWSRRDWDAYQGMSQECHPVWRDLHAGRVYEGQDVDQVMQTTAPTRTDHLGTFVALTYHKHPGRGIPFTSIMVLAHEGKLCRAVADSCTWNYTFFDRMSEAENAELRQEWTKRFAAQEAEEVD